MPLTDIPAGHVGAVVTFLEMTERPRPQPAPDAPLQLVRWREVDPAKYRTLFERVGGRWLWYSRLAMDNSTLLASVGEVHAVVDRRRVEVGMIELDFRQAGECLIRFLGLVPELAGRGHGKWLFAQTLALAWRAEVRRVHVNTCSLDHPAALPSYVKAGFTPNRRAFETFPDPRLLGLLPRDAAPQIPLVGSSASWA
jgi:GNAT superfamily N-acetyltransferase